MISIDISVLLRFKTLHTFMIFIDISVYLFSELLCSENVVHLGLGQAQALHVVGENVLWRGAGHRCLSKQEDQSHI